MFGKKKKKKEGLYIKPKPDYVKPPYNRFVEYKSPQGLVLKFDIEKKTIKVKNLNKELTISKIYSSLKNAWKDTDELIRYHFCVQGVSRVLMVMQDGWTLHKETRDYLKNN